jgi:hypothetical protein
VRQADLVDAPFVSTTVEWAMMWDTLWQFLPLIALATSATVWMVRDVARSTSTPRQPKTH